MPLPILYVFVARVMNKIHNVSIFYWLKIKLYTCYTVNIYKNKPVYFFQKGGGVYRPARRSWIRLWYQHGGNLHWSPHVITLCITVSIAAFSFSGGLSTACCGIFYWNNVHGYITYWLERLNENGGIIKIYCYTRWGSYGLMTKTWCLAKNVTAHRLRFFSGPAINIEIALSKTVVEIAKIRA